MKIKNLLSAVLIFLFSAPVIAQFGIQAGAVVSDMNMKSYGEKSNTDMGIGITAGLFYRQQFAPSFAIQPEMNWIQKGGINNVDGDKYNVILDYLEVPLYLLYTSKGSKGFFGGVGPSMNFGLRGKVNVGDNENKVAFGNDGTADLKGFHLGLNFLAGYTFNSGWQVSGFSGFSITDSNPTESTNGSKVDLNLFHAGIRIGFMDKK